MLLYLTEIYMNINAYQKIVITAFSFSILIGISYAQELHEDVVIEKPLSSSEESRYVRYGQRMINHSQDDNYCNNSPCSNYQRVSKMSFHDRQMLRQQVNEAGKTIYQHH